MEVIYLIKEAIVYNENSSEDGKNWFTIYAIKDYNKMLENLRKLENESITNEKGLNFTGIFRYEETHLFDE